MAFVDSKVFFVLFRTHFWLFHVPSRSSCDYNQIPVFTFKLTCPSGTIEPQLGACLLGWSVTPTRSAFVTKRHLHSPLVSTAAASRCCHHRIIRAPSAPAAAAAPRLRLRAASAVKKRWCYTLRWHSTELQFGISSASLHLFLLRHTAQSPQ